MKVTGDDETGTKSGLAVPAPGKYAVLGDSGQGFGVVGLGGGPAGVYGESNMAPPDEVSNGGIGVHGVSSANTGIGVRGDGVLGVSGIGRSTGVDGFSPRGIGVWGSSQAGEGVRGASGAGTGVRGNSDSGPGVFGSSGLHYGLFGESANIGAHTRCTSLPEPPDSMQNSVDLSGPEYAGVFWGKVLVTGELQKPGGGFLIDHPGDPANKYLTHSFVESDVRMNIYSGVAVLDENGEAVIALPEYFEALNRDPRYQLTCLGEHALVFIAKKIEGNRFLIAGGRKNLQVSWQVTCERADIWATHNPLVAEREKAPEEQGYYLTPELFGQSAEKSVRRALIPKDPEVPPDLPPRTPREVLRGGGT
jgi:hypothetical protein